MAKDRKIDMLILGILNHGNRSGYDIKREIDRGISFFWKGSFGSIYPALAAMEQDGRIRKVEQDGRPEKAVEDGRTEKAVEDSRTGNAEDAGQDSRRVKILYSITEAGRESLREWMKSSKVSNDLKYESLLKLYFGGSVGPKFTVEVIEQFEEDVRRDLQVLKGYQAVLENALDEPDHVYFYLTVTFGVDSYETYLTWCEKAKRMLRNSPAIMK